MLLTQNNKSQNIFPGWKSSGQSVIRKLREENYIRKSDKDNDML